MHNNECVDDCPIEYFPVDELQRCERCVHPCKDCISLSKCASCAVGFTLMGETCVDECPPLYLEINQVCERCKLPCKECSNSL